MLERNIINKYKTILLQSSQMDLCFILFHFVPLYFIFIKDFGLATQAWKRIFLTQLSKWKKNLEWYNHKLMEKNLDWNEILGALSRKPFCLLFPQVKPFFNSALRQINSISFPISD